MTHWNRPSGVDREVASRLPSSYKNAHRWWRHSLHTVCSRVAMFPAQMVHYFLLRYTEPGDLVADYWAGMGTAPLEASLNGRLSLGNDISPEAFAVLQAKLNPPTPVELGGYLKGLEKSMMTNLGEDLDDLGESLGIRWYYHKKTLQQILSVRKALEEDLESSSRKLSQNAMFTRALMLGILHGDRQESISIPLDSSKALSIRHVKRMKKEFPMRYRARHKRPLGDSLRLKASKVMKDPFLPLHGIARNTDASRLKLPRKAKMVFTSPPYLTTHTYAYDNRIRLWFLREDYRIVARKLFDTDSTDWYLDYMVRCLRNIEDGLESNSVCFLVVGDIRNDKGDVVRLGELISDAWRDAASTEMEITRIITDRIRPTTRRYFNLRKSDGPRLERILEFHKGRPLEKTTSIDWKAL